MPQRTRNIFNPKSGSPFKLSRSRLENFIKCLRCFYLDRRLGIDVPPTPAFTLNSAVDQLLKKEFDAYRARREPHPLMVQHGLNAIPFTHPDLDTWRENFKGVQFYHVPSNFLVTGAIDDLWEGKGGELYVVDYKSTSKDGEIELTDAPWHQAYRRQIEIYQWLLRQNGFPVSTTGYWVYVNGRRDSKAFNEQLLFRTQLIPHVGDDSWVESTLFKAHACLMSDELPASDAACEYCRYREAARDVETS